MYDVAGFTWKDVQSLKPEWTQEKCEEIFDRVTLALHERLVETGWEILEILIDWEV
jgi:hypothetical protein